MKITNRWIAALLTLAMVFPVAVGVMPLTAVAAESETVYNEFFDFEDAGTLKDGTLSTAYLTKRIKNGNFSTVNSGDGFYPSDNDRVPEAWKVVTDEETGRVYIDHKTKSEFSKTGDFSLFTLKDADGLLYKQAYQISFDFRPEYCKNTASLVHVTHNKFQGSDGREALINVKGDTSTTYVSVSSSSFKIAITNGEWYRITIRVIPSTGSVKFWIEDEDGTLLGSESKTSTKIKNFSALETFTGSAISIGYAWGASVIQNFALDNISLVSGVAVDEEQTFTDVYDSADLYIKDSIADKENTTFTATNFNKNSSTNPYLNYLTVVEEADGNKYLREYIPKEASYKYGTEGGGTVENGGDGKNYHFAAGINYQNPNLLKEAFEISVRYKYDSITTGSTNVIRFEGSGGTIAPLVIYGGGRVTTTSNWYVVLRKTDAGYVTYHMPKETWHTYRVVVDPETSNYEMYMTVGDGTEEQLYFLKTPLRASEGSNWSTVYTEDQVKTTACFIDYGASYTMANWTSMKLWLIHGTNNFVNKGGCHDFHADDISIKTVNSTKVAEFFDFESYAPYTFGWEKDTFAVVNSNSNSAPVTDWEVVNDPVSGGKRGRVLHTHTQNGRTASIFSLRDTGNALLSQAFDISFDLYLPRTPSNDVNMLKIYTAYNDSTGAYDKNKYFTPFVLRSSGLLRYGTADGHADTAVSTTLSLNTWYTLRARIDLAAGTYSTYVDDVLIQTNKVDDAYPNKNMLSALNKLQFEICSQWSVTSGPTAAYYIDNVRIETVKEAVRFDPVGEIIGYDIVNVDFEDGGEWLADAKSNALDLVAWSYSYAETVENAGVAGNHAVEISGSLGGSMNVLLPAKSTFTVAASLCYEDTFGSSVNFVTLSDPALAGGESTLLSIKGQTAGDEYNGALYFVQNGITYYLCDSIGRLLHVGETHTETASFTDVAVVIDAETDSYSVYVNGLTAHYMLDGEVAWATDLPLGMGEGKSSFENPSVYLIETPTNSHSNFHLYLDDICISSVDNGLAPVLVGYQENHSVAGAVRFLATVDTLYCQNLGFEVTANGETKTVSGNAVYTSVIANGETHTATDFQGRYITALVITDIDEAGVSFEVRPFVTFFGKTVYGEPQTVVFNGEAAQSAAE